MGVIIHGTVAHAKDLRSLTIVVAVGKVVSNEYAVVLAIAVLESAIMRS